MELLSWGEFFAGCVGGASGVVVGHPFDTVKVRMQTGVEKLILSSSIVSNPPSKLSSAHVRAAANSSYLSLFSPAVAQVTCKRNSARAFSSTSSIHVTPNIRTTRSMFDVIVHMARQEGWRSFYRGMSFPLLSAGVQNAIFFATYQGSLGVFGSGREKQNAYAEGQSSRSKTQHYTSIFIAGCIAGAAQLGIAVPVDVVKTRLQVETANIERRQLRKAIKTFVDIRLNEGWRALYRGTVPQAVCMVPGFGIYMLAYSVGLDVCRRVDKNTEKTDRMWAILLAGGFAGMIAWQTTVPFDIVKTKMQSNMLAKRKPGVTARQFSPFDRIEVLSAMQQIVRDEGWRGLTRGFVPITLRAFPTNVAVFGLYELSYAYFSRNKAKKLSGSF